MDKKHLPLIFMDKVSIRLWDRIVFMKYPGVSIRISSGLFAVKPVQEKLC